jgi:regulator of protease activity HflC (stomatin/prohibitin superfamily)
MTQNQFDINQAKKAIQKIMKGSLPISIVGLSIVGFMLFSMCFSYVKPYEYGVKQVNIGIKRGIQSKVYETGYHFLIPFGFEVMHKFPKDIQVFELSNKQQSYIDIAQERAANIQTSDGFFVVVDVSILYRIIDPVKVIKSIGPGKLYIENGIMPKAEPALKDALGKLTTE